MHNVSSPSGQTHDQNFLDSTKSSQLHQTSPSASKIATPFEDPAPSSLVFIASTSGMIVAEQIEVFRKKFGKDVRYYTCTDQMDATAALPTTVGFAFIGQEFDTCFLFETLEKMTDELMVSTTVSDELDDGEASYKVRNAGIAAVESRLN